MLNASVKKTKCNSFFIFFLFTGIINNLSIDLLIWINLVYARYLLEI
jgi:hypothetical protein